MTTAAAVNPHSRFQPTSEKSNEAVEAQELEFGQIWDGAAKAAPNTTKTGAEDHGRRKSSVQFHTANAEETIRRESIVNPPKIPVREKRMASPPPPSHYSRGVSFDTFDNKEASTESFTLRYKHRDYAHSARSRTFLCGTDAKDYSEYALEWMIDELVDDGDEIVCLRVIEKEDKPLIHAKYRQEAEKLLDSVIKKNSSEDKAISMIMELAVGRVQEIFQRMVSACPLDHRAMLTLKDCPLRTLSARCWHTRSQPGRHARTHARLSFEILSATFTSPCYCCTALV